MTRAVAGSAGVGLIGAGTWLSAGPGMTVAIAVSSMGAIQDLLWLYVGFTSGRLCGGRCIECRADYRGHSGLCQRREPEESSFSRILGPGGARLFVSFRSRRYTALRVPRRSSPAR